MKSRGRGIMVVMDDRYDKIEVNRIIERAKRKVRQADKFMSTLSESPDNGNSPDFKRKETTTRSISSFPKRRKLPALDEEGDVINTSKEERKTCKEEIKSHIPKRKHPVPSECVETELDTGKYNSRLKRLIKFQENKKKRKTRDFNSQKPVSESKVKTEEYSSAECTVKHEPVNDLRVPYTSPHDLGLPDHIQPTYDPSVYVSLDCEFVGTGPKGSVSALGRCTIVDYNGQVVCDIYSNPGDYITDFRTRYSGLRPNYLKKAIPFERARIMIKRILQGKILIGHAVFNDLRVLRLTHPPAMIRDTVKYNPLHQMASVEGQKVPRSLKKLTLALLGRTIQRREHCSREDAVATLELFKLVQHRWDAEVAHQCESRPNNPRNKTFSESSMEDYLNDRFWPNDV